METQLSVVIFLFETQLSIVMFSCCPFIDVIVVLLIRMNFIVAKCLSFQVVQYITSVFKYTSNICHLGEDY